MWAGQIICFTSTFGTAARSEHDGAGPDLPRAAERTCRAPFSRCVFTSGCHAFASSVTNPGEMIVTRAVLEASCGKPFGDSAAQAKNFVRGTRPTGSAPSLCPAVRSGLTKMSENLGCERTGTRPAMTVSRKPLMLMSISSPNLQRAGPPRRTTGMF